MRMVGMALGETGHAHVSTVDGLRYDILQPLTSYFN